MVSEFNTKLSLFLLSLASCMLDCSSNAFGHAENADQSRKTTEGKLSPLPLRSSRSLPLPIKTKLKLTASVAQRQFPRNREDGRRERERERERVQNCKRKTEEGVGSSVGWKIDWVEVGKKCGGDEKNAICGFHRSQLLFFFLNAL